MSRAVGPDAIYTVPDELLAEVGLRRGRPPSQSYVCSTPDARVVPITLLASPPACRMVAPAGAWA